MRSVRLHTFETNSSSTHSITLCYKEDFDRWKNDSSLLMSATGVVKTVEEAKAEVIAQFDKNDKSPTEKQIASRIKCDYMKYDDSDSSYSDTEYYEVENVMPDGKIVVAFGSYGYDG